MPTFRQAVRTLLRNVVRLPAPEGRVPSPFSAATIHEGGQISLFCQQREKSRRQTLVTIDFHRHARLEGPGLWLCDLNLGRTSRSKDDPSARNVEMGNTRNSRRAARISGRPAGVGSGRVASPEDASRFVAPTVHAEAQREDVEHDEGGNDDRKSDTCVKHVPNTPLPGRSMVDRARGRF